MKIQWHFKFFIFLILAFFTSIYILLNNFLSTQFYTKAEDLTQTIALAVENIEEEIDKTLLVTSILVQDKLKNKELKNDDDLKKLASQVGVTTISILSDATGKFIMTSAGNFDKNHSFYQELSLLDIKQCATQICDGKLCRTSREIQTCQMKRSEVKRIMNNNLVKHALLPIYMPPLYSDKKTSSPVKWIVKHDPTLGVIIDIFYSKQELDKILKEFLKINSGYLRYILITDAFDNKILEEGTSKNDSLVISVDMNRKWNMRIEGEDIVYHYKIRAEFSKKDLHLHLIIILIVFVLIVLISIFTISIFRLKMWTKDEMLNTLKSISKSKNK